MRQTLVLGGPGAGKTDRLLKAMEEALDGGVRPNRIAFVAYTKAAASEAKARACSKFGLTEEDFPFIRTEHSLAFRQLGLRKDDVLGEEHLSELAELTGELITNPGGATPDEGPAGKRNADELLTVDHYARTTRKGLHEAWRDHGGEIDWHRLKRFSASYRLYKEDRGLVDFTDMLDLCVTNHLPPVGVDIAIIDEAQDFTSLQWAVADQLFSVAKELWVAGDDDQSIHAWAGADENHFLHLGYDREVLPLSHRLPQEIFAFASSVISKVDKRYSKEWTSSGRSGQISWINRTEECDLSKGSWLLMTRTRGQLATMAQLARSQGVVYTMKGVPSVKLEHLDAIRAYEDLRAGKRVSGESVRMALKAAGVRKTIDVDSSYTALELGFDASPIWHDALIKIPVEDREYYLTCLRRGESLSKKPRVRIETIHGAKGTEADHVLLMTDMTYRTRRAYELDPDSEYRVMYVGLTRAIQSLYLLAPQTQYGFPL